MWPLVQSNDACTFHPIRAVTALEKREVTKKASEIDVGDIVFCRVQTSKQYYAHIVIEISRRGNKEKYWIGNIKQHSNGWCYKEHIYGILVAAEVRYGSYLYSRPQPKSIYKEVLDLVKDDRWSKAADRLCRGRRF